MASSAPRSYPMSARTVISQEQILAATSKVAKQIAKDYAPFNLTTKNPLVLVCVLKGSLMFTADLARALGDEGVPVRLEFICATSYGSGVETSGQVRILLDVRDSVENQHVLLIEDIVDSAVTLKYLKRMFAAKKPASLKLIALLDKKSGRKVDLEADYPVIPIAPGFVIGYGLDFAEAYRELRDVCILKPEYYEKESKL